MRFAAIAGMVLCGGILLQGRKSVVRAEEVPSEYKAVVKKGLDWLVKQQFRDGHWDSNGQHPEAMTGLSGLALLMEGSTLRDGKFADNLRRAVDWLISRSQSSGLICNPQDHWEGSHYMYGHGYSMVFLASVYGEESDRDLRRKLENVLTRAVLFTGRAQDVHGGWHYISAADGGGGDSSSTVTQMQALRAARNAGIVVPKEILNKGLDYLRQTTSSDGGVCYGWGMSSGGSPALTAAALASGFSAGEYQSDLVKKWIRFCQRYIPFGSGGRLGHDEYMHFYLAQAMYNLGEDRYGKLFPEARPEQHLTWSKYRKAIFDQMRRSQSADGGWNSAGWGMGPVYAAALHLNILQLDNATLPFFQR